MRTAEQLGEVAQPPVFGWLVEIRVDRVLDRSQIVDVRPAAQQRQPVDQELAVGCGVVELERIEARRRSRTQHVVAPADRADEDFGTAILVEENDARAELARLREQEVEHHGLARPRWPDDGEIAEVALVEIEEIRACSGCFEQCHRFAPVVPLRLAQCKIMPARKSREIAR